MATSPKIEVEMTALEVCDALRAWFELEHANLARELHPLEVATWNAGTEGIRVTFVRGSGKEPR